MTLSGHLCLIETACGCRKWIRLPRPVPELRLPLMYPIGVADMIDGPVVSASTVIAARRFILATEHRRGRRRYFRYREVR